MKRVFYRLLVALASVAGFLSSAQANLAYVNGDLLLGFRTTSDPGANRDYVLNLGPASQFTQATGPVVVSGLGDVATDLGIFSDPEGAAWFERPDVFWGVVGTDLAGDPGNTLYATRPRADINTQSTPWPRSSFSTQSATNSNIRAFISGYTLSAANAASPKGAIQLTSATNSYAFFTTGGADFGVFGGIEGDFTNGTAGSVLDLYRLAPTTQNPSGAGLVFVGTFQINNSAQITFTPAPPVAPSYRFSAATYTFNEDAGTVNLQVIRGGLTTGADSVQFNTSDGTALGGTHYTAKTGFTVNFAPTETQASVSVDLTNIPGLQASRAFTATLSSPNPASGTLGTPSTATVTINDTAPQNFGQIAFSAPAYSFAPVNSQGLPNALAVTLNRVNGSDGAVSVEVSVAAGGTLVHGTDFNNFTSPTPVQFAAGETTKTVALQLAALDDAKLPGTINLSLGNAQNGATLGTNVTATITVTAKDKVKPSFKLASKPGKVLSPTYVVAGTAKDNTDISRVEVKVNGGAAQLATLGALANGSRTLHLGGINLENGKNTIVVTAFDTSGNAAKSTTLKVTYANHRPALAGSYTGLLTAVTAPVNSTTGLVTLKVTPFGLFTGKVTIGAAVLPVTGIFDNAGVAHFNAKGDTTAAPAAWALSKKIGVVTTQFGSLALAIATDKVTGSLKDGGAQIIANLDADRAVFDGKTPATTVAASYLANKGNYTVVFPARATQIGRTAAEFPQGDGAATLKITAKGAVTLKGTLADGTPVVAAGPLSKDYRWAFFAKLYKGQGAITAPVTFDDTQADSDAKGANVLWIRPPVATAKHYPLGWSGGILTDLFAAKYVSVPGTAVLPGLGAPDLTNGNANLAFADGKLGAPITETVSISPTNKVTNAPADKSFALSIKAATGLISGKFKHTDNTSPAFKGAIYQKGPDAGGYGYFLSTVPKNAPSGESGGVSLEAK